MPAGVSAKNSARTGNHFYKNSYNGNKTVVMKQYVGGNEESPPRVMNNDNSNELLPNLNIKVIYYCLLINSMIIGKYF
jgi:hypothetical protein